MSTVCDPVKHPAMASTGMSGMPEPSLDGMIAVSSSFSILPLPVISQLTDMSGYTRRIFSNLSVPIAPPFLRHLPNEALDIPMLFSNAAIDMPLLSMYCFNRSNIIASSVKN